VLVAHLTSSCESQKSCWFHTTWLSSSQRSASMIKCPGSKLAELPHIKWYRLSSTFIRVDMNTHYRPTQPSIPPGSVNKYQLRLGRNCMVHSVSGCTQGVQVKLWDPLRTCATPERLSGVITTRRYTNPRLPLPYPNESVHIAIHSNVNRVTFTSSQYIALYGILTSGLLCVLSDTGASNWQIIGDFFWRTKYITDITIPHALYNISLSHFHIFLFLFFFPVMLYYSYTLMFSLFYSIVAMLLCVVLFAPWWHLSVRKWKDYLLTYLLIYRQFK